MAEQSGGQVITWLLEHWPSVLLGWSILAVITVVLWCRIIHNDKAREAGQGKLRA